MYLFDFLSKVISLIVLIPTTLFGINDYQENEMNLDNANNNINTNVTSFVEEHDTEYTYNPKLPYNVSNVIQKGVDKITYTVNGDEEKVLQEAVTEVIEKGTGAYGEFTGRLTGYSAECAGCSPEGYVACFTEDRKQFSITKDGLYYKDDEYGSVRVIAAAKQKFPCGTIVKITKIGYEPYYTIVLDRGGAMNKAWEQGGVLIDLSFNNDKEALASDLTGRNIKFSVQRWGW